MSTAFCFLVALLGIFGLVAFAAVINRGDE